MESKPIVIIGAGVIGISTAILLQQRYPSRQITIIAAEIPAPSPMVKLWSKTDGTLPSPSYASMWAGAHYRPIPGSTPQLRQEADFCRRTARTMRTIAKKWPEAGVKIMKGTDYFEDLSADISHLMTGSIFASEGDGFRVLDQSELPLGVQWGCEYDTYCANVHLYCNWLLSRFLREGGRLVQKRLENVRDAFEALSAGPGSPVPLVINCSGRNFEQDPKVKTMRGQTVLVRNRFHQTITRIHSNGQWTFLIPRPLGGGTIVGGTKDLGDEDIEVRPETRAAILRRAVEHFPQFVDSLEKFEVVQDIVGQRPWREGGVRIELESLGDGKHIFHGYGAGGRGYEMSWGIAEDIIALVMAASHAPSKL